VLS
ncbi:tRNA synthetases class II core domain family protein, partial [Vibrio parahaemolyticus V-223/04]|jgi:hypothetical protein